MTSIIDTATIMVIDDLPDNLKFLFDILTTHGYRVRAFTNSRLALQSAEQNPPDLVLLDINMPDLNGYEVCLALKSHAQLKNIPVIFLSALTGTREKVKAFQCGGVDFITKPFEPEEIKARINTHLSLATMDALQDEIRMRQETEKKYYDHLDNQSDAVILVNQSGTIVYSNPATENTFGYPPGELLNQPVEILIPEEKRQIHNQYLKNYFQSPSTRKMSTLQNVHALKKNGHTFPVDINLSILYSGSELLISTQIRDISKQVRLQKELELQQQLFDEAFGKTSDGIIMIDNSGKIFVTNPRAPMMLGYPKEEIMGKNLEFIFQNKNEFNTVISHFTGSASNPHETSLSTNIKRKDASTIPVEITIIPLGNNRDSHQALFTVIRDISERVKMEKERALLVKQLIQAQKMESLGQLTGGIAHDFNNILASIMGFAELGVEHIDELTSKPTKQDLALLSEYLEEIHISGNRAKALIEQMLLFSRNTTSGNREDVDIAMLIDESIHMLRPVLPTTIRINLYRQDNIPKIRAIPVQLHQILMNICINARDAMDNHGHIDIGLRVIIPERQTCTSCHEIVSGQHLELSVHDSGPGMSDRIIERVFEPFFTTKEFGKGTGMGLAMVHGIIHNHDGHVIVESKPGQGTSFKILFPVHESFVEEIQTDPAIEKEEIA